MSDPSSSPPSFRDIAKRSVAEELVATEQVLANLAAPGVLRPLTILTIARIIGRCAVEVRAMQKQLDELVADSARTTISTHLALQHDSNVIPFPGPRGRRRR